MPKSTKIGDCVICGERKRLLAKRACSKCYRSEFAPKSECVRCKKHRPIKSKAMCSSCYETARIESCSEKSAAKRDYLKQYRNRPGNVIG